MKLDTVPGGLQEMEVREWAIKSEEWQERGGEGLTSLPLTSYLWYWTIVLKYLLYFSSLWR